MMPVHNNIWYMGKVWFHWEGIENTSVILTDLFCNKTELYYNHTRIWYNTAVGTIQLPYINKPYDNTDLDD